MVIFTYKVSYELYYGAYCTQSIIAIKYLIRKVRRDLFFNNNFFLTNVCYFYCRQMIAVKTNILKMGVARVMVNVTDRESVPTGI